MGQNKATTARFYDFDETRAQPQSRQVRRYCERRAAKLPVKVEVLHGRFGTKRIRVA